MRNDRFEWDDDKARRNERKHGVTFDEACEVFDDPNAVFEPDDEPNEERWQIIGMTRSGLLFVVSTERGERERIITARRAEKHEQDRYRGHASP